MRECEGTVHRCRDAVAHLGSLILAAGLAALAGCGSSAGPEHPNGPPSLSMQPDTSCAVGETLLLQASASDPDGDPLRYSALVDLTLQELGSGYRPAIEMDGTSGQFRLEASGRDVPARRITFFAEDGRGGEDSTSFWVAIH